MLNIGDEVYIVNDGGQYTGVCDVRWTEELPMYDPSNQKGYIGETAIVSILIEHGNSEDGFVYGLTLPSGENLIYEEFDYEEEFLEKI